MEENNQQNQKSRQKNFPVIIIIFGMLFLAFLGAWYFVSKMYIPEFLPEIPVSPVAEEKITEKEDSVSTINQELEKIEILNLDEEFRPIDEDLNYL